MENKFRIFLKIKILTLKFRNFFLKFQPWNIILRLWSWNFETFSEISILKFRLIKNLHHIIHFPYLKSMKISTLRTSTMCAMLNIVNTIWKLDQLKNKSQVEAPSSLAYSVQAPSYHKRLNYINVKLPTISLLPILISPNKIFLL